MNRHILNVKLFEDSMNEDTNSPEPQASAFAPAGSGADSLSPPIGNDSPSTRRRLPSERLHHSTLVQEARAAEPAQRAEEEIAADAINPSHYRKHPSGIECIEVTRHLNFNIGNAIKYLWRYMDKGDPVENLKKAQWYIDDEIRRLMGSR